MKDLRVIAFDADDTLWDCQSHFEAVENHLYELIQPYCETPSKELFITESGNMADLGYGCKAFTISIIETALRVAGDHLYSAYKPIPIDWWYSPRASCKTRRTNSIVVDWPNTSRT